MDFMSETLRALEDIDKRSLLKSSQENAPIPDRKEVILVIKDVQYLMFPQYFKSSQNVDRETIMYAVYRRLKKQIQMACDFSQQSCSMNAVMAAETFVASLPSIKELLIKDIEAIYEGDPAAKFRDEVLICYPGFYAISIYRMANVLYKLGVPLIPRMMTEYAHEKTGIDIHAGATIGEYFFIDHGTGIVVGETTVIGNNVKMYQGATLGALSPAGMPTNPDERRHPKVGSNVVIYANSTLLGGATEIGDNVIIGGNAFLTSSVEANTIVSVKMPEPTFRGKRKKD